jgi:phytoene/squalene synthetase
MPLESHDPKEAARICAAASRLTLQDFAPALILLPETERLRAQALTALTLTLFDFAAQPGLEGERLAQINRWEFALEAALGGEPPGQPIFVQMAALEKHDPWSRDGLDRLFGLARHRVASRRPPTVAAAERQSTDLGQALSLILLGSTVDAPLAGLTAALLRISSLQRLGEDLRRQQPQLAVEELPDHWHSAIGDNVATLARVVQSECDRLRPLLLEADGALRRIHSPFRRAARYAHAAGKLLLAQIERGAGDIVLRPPRLGLATRFWLLVRSRW